MNNEVTKAIEQLKCAYSLSAVIACDDGAGGARVIVEEVDLGPRFEPRITWMGGHITGLYPYADIYPVFIDAGVCRVDGKPFEAPVTPGHNFQGRPALQVSRVNRQVQCTPQTAVIKFSKIVEFLDSLQ